MRHVVFVLPLLVTITSCVNLNPSHQQEQSPELVRMRYAVTATASGTELSRADAVATTIDGGAGSVRVVFVEDTYKVGRRAEYSEFLLKIENGSDADIYSPKLKVTKFLSRDGKKPARGTITTSDNGVPGEGALFDYGQTLGADQRLAAGAITPPRRWHIDDPQVGFQPYVVILELTYFTSPSGGGGGKPELGNVTTSLIAGGWSSSSYTITAPASLSAGDLVLVAFTAAATRDHSSTTVTPPDGFSLVGRGINDTASGHDHVLWVYVKTATSSEPTSYTFNLSKPAEGWISATQITGATAVSASSMFFLGFKSSPYDMPAVDGAAGNLLVQFAMSSWKSVQNVDSNPTQTRFIAEATDTGGGSFTGGWDVLLGEEAPAERQWDTGGHLGNIVAGSVMIE